MGLIIKSNENGKCFLRDEILSSIGGRMGLVSRPTLPHTFGKCFCANSLLPRCAGHVLGGRIAGWFVEGEKSE